MDTYILTAEEVHIFVERMIIFILILFLTGITARLSRKIVVILSQERAPG